jgi:hypothetical protein
VFFHSASSSLLTSVDEAREDEQQRHPPRLGAREWPRMCVGVSPLSSLCLSVRPAVCCAAVVVPVLRGEHKSKKGNATGSVLYVRDPRSPLNSDRCVGRSGMSSVCCSSVCRLSLACRVVCVDCPVVSFLRCVFGAAVFVLFSLFPFFLFSPFAVLVCSPLFSGEAEASCSKTPTHSCTQQLRSAHNRKRSV